jgi:hypothetical protein
MACCESTWKRLLHAFVNSSQAYVKHPKPLGNGRNGQAWLYHVNATSWDRHLPDFVQKEDAQKSAQLEFIIMWILWKYLACTNLSWHVPMPLGYSAKSIYMEPMYGFCPQPGVFKTAVGSRFEVTSLLQLIRFTARHGVDNQLEFTNTFKCIVLQVLITFDTIARGFGGHLRHNDAHAGNIFLTSWDTDAPTKAMHVHHYMMEDLRVCMTTACRAVVGDWGFAVLGPPLMPREVCSKYVSAFKWPENCHVDVLEPCQAYDITMFLQTLRHLITSCRPRLGTEEAGCLPETVADERGELHTVDVVVDVGGKGASSCENGGTVAGTQGTPLPVSPSGAARFHKVEVFEEFLLAMNTLPKAAFDNTSTDAKSYGRMLTPTPTPTPVLNYLLRRRDSMSSQSQDLASPPPGFVADACVLAGTTASVAEAHMFGHGAQGASLLDISNDAAHALTAGNALLTPWNVLKAWAHTFFKQYISSCSEPVLGTSTSTPTCYSHDEVFAEFRCIGGAGGVGSAANVGSVGGVGGVGGRFSIPFREGIQENKTMKDILEAVDAQWNKIGHAVTKVVSPVSGVGVDDAGDRYGRQRVATPKEEDMSKPIEACALLRGDIRPCDFAASKGAVHEDRNTEVAGGAGIYVTPVQAMVNYGTSASPPPVSGEIAASRRTKLMSPPSTPLKAVAAADSMAVAAEVVMAAPSSPAYCEVSLYTRVHPEGVNVGVPCYKRLHRHKRKRGGSES